MHSITPELNHFPLLFQLALDLFRRPSPSGREELTRAYVSNHLEACGCTVSVDSTGNVLAVRGTPAPGEGYPLLSFHMDCVSYGPPRSFSPAPVSATGDRARPRSWQRTQPLDLRPLEALVIEGEWLHSQKQFVLGGDDKCGGAIALALAATTTGPLKIVASVQEEIGCVGIDEVDPRFFQDVAYALVLDRRGANHLIVSIGGHLLCQGAFAAAMMRAAAETGLLVYAAEGALSDALAISHLVPNVVNLSVGYYHPHSVDERVSLVDLWHSYQWVHRALGSLPCQLSAFSERRRTPGFPLLCPTCQKLLIAPAALPDEFGTFVCQCAAPVDAQGNTPVVSRSSH